MLLENLALKSGDRNTASGSSFAFIFLRMANITLDLSADGKGPGRREKNVDRKSK